MGFLFENEMAADMYKNQLQELAQRSCFNLPCYACIREGPDHAPRFRASVNFNGEIFESTNYCSTLRQAEHAAAEVALNVLSSRCPSRSITARVLDETGVYKNLLQETAHRAGLNLPVYTTVRSGPGHHPVFTCTVNIASMNFTGVPAKTKKQAEKNAAIAAWSALKTMPNLGSLSQTNKETDTHEEEEDHVLVSRVLSSYKIKDESKQVRRWDQYWGRRRASSSSTSNSSNMRPPPPLPPPPPPPPIDLFINSTTQKQKSFMPPPPTTASKRLPYALEEHQIDNDDDDDEEEEEEEWRLGGDTTIQKKPVVTIGKEGLNNSSITTGYDTSSIYRLFPLLNVSNNSTSQNGQTHMSNRVGFGPPNPSSPIMPAAAAPMKLPPTTGGGGVHKTTRPIYSGGFNPHRRFAPAVQIRSVIPVCASPPPSSNPHSVLHQQASPSSNPHSVLHQQASPSSNPHSVLHQQASPSSSSTTTCLVPTQTGPDQGSLISSKSNKLQFRK